MVEELGRTRVLVTGGAGMLGSDFAREALHFPQFDLKALSREELDVRDTAAISEFADWVAGGWIVHCAALVDVEGCARDPERARATIVDGTSNVARLAAQADARILYPQSFLVYDGSQYPMPEELEPNPLHLYGELKYEAERIVAAETRDPLIIRMAGFFGGGAKDKNFVGRIIPVIKAAMDKGESTFSVGDRVWQPTWTKDLAFNSLALMARGAAGTWQMGSLGEASFAEIAEIIVEELGWSHRIAIERVSATAIAGSELGRRPDRAVLSCERLNRERMNLQRDWAATLRAYLADHFFDRYRLANT